MKKKIKQKPGYTIEDIMEEIEELKKKKKVEELFKCVVCGKPLIKIGEYQYKGNCKHVPKNWRLSVG